MKNILLYGKGKVGQSLARLCDHLGYTYALCDDTDCPSDFAGFDHIIPSPGIPSSHAIYQTNRIISELDFLSAFIPRDFSTHAITGTDGKSTTAWIVYHFLQEGFPDQVVYLGGNFGTPLAEIVLDILQKDIKQGHIVLEVSSFMAYSLQKFAPDNSILTNLHPDHLDWHGTLDEYYHAKIRLLARTKHLIICPSSVCDMFPEIRDFPIRTREIAETIELMDTHFLCIEEGVYLDISERLLLGNHNIRNILSAAHLCRSLGLSTKRLSEILVHIPALDHRLQTVPTSDGRIWIDDSKSTTAQSLYAALSSFGDKKVVLIAGGKDKGDPFEGLSDHLSRHCALCIALGETRHTFLEAAHTAFVPAVPVSSLEEAVRYAYENSTPDSIILLSPGCSSLDMYQNYSERAQVFRTAISTTLASI